MVAILENPVVRERVMPWTVEQYHLLYDLNERTELIRGAVVEKMSQPPAHSSAVEVIADLLRAILAHGFIVRQEKPLTLADSEPEPDLAVIRGDRAQFLEVHPTTAELVVEVCVTSEALDRLKLELYAEAGVPECWLVFPETQTVERHTRLENGAYRQIDRATAPETLESTIIAGLALPPPGLARGLA